MDGLFDSAWHKWVWAVRHAQILDAEIDRVALNSQHDPFVGLGHQYQPHRRGFAIRVQTIQPIPAWWNLMVGDVVANFRASLDHLAWALVQRGCRANTLTEDEERNVYFPIGKSAGHLRYLLEKRGRLLGARRADIAVVRRYQPYRRGKRLTQWHCFTILDGLANGDKHREVQGLWMVPEISEIKVLDTVNCNVSAAGARGGRVLMDIGTEVAFIRVRKTCRAKPGIDVQYTISAYPAFHPRLYLQHWIDITAVTIALLLGEFAEPPPEVETFASPDFEAWLNKARDTWVAHATGGAGP